MGIRRAGTEGTPSGKPSDSPFVKDEKVKDLVSLSVLLHPNLEQKMRQQWHQVREAFLKMDKDRNGVVTREEMWHTMCNVFHLPITISEFDRLFRFLDTDNSGNISYLEFNEKVGEIMGAREDGGHGYELQKRGVQREFGRRRELDVDVAWNNIHRQVLVEEGAGKGKSTLIGSLMEGNYFVPAPGVYYKDYDMEPGIARSFDPRRFDFDEKRQQPLMASLLHGAFHRNEKRTSRWSHSDRSRNSFVVRNIRLARTFTPRNSQTFRREEIPLRKSVSINGHSQEITEPNQKNRKKDNVHHLQLQGVAIKTVGKKEDFNPSNPQTKEELQFALKRRVSEKDAKPVIRWLSALSEIERENYLEMVGSRPVSAVLTPRPPSSRNSNPISSTKLNRPLSARVAKIVSSAGAEGVITAHPPPRRTRPMSAK